MLPSFLNRFVSRRTLDTGPDMTPEETARVGWPVDIVPKDNYAPPEQTYIPQRAPKVITSYFFFSPMGAWTSDDFLIDTQGPTPHATYARGIFETGPTRQNIARPAAQSYGSLVPEIDTPPYGLD